MPTFDVDGANAPLVASLLMFRGTWTGYATKYPALFPIKRFRGDYCVCGRYLRISNNEANKVVAWLKAGYALGSLPYAAARWQGSTLVIVF